MSELESKDLPIYAVSAPSGVGKTTLIHKLIQKYPNKLMLSISDTTRSIRSTEIADVDYHFVSTEEFQKNIPNMLEWANVHGNLYGTSKKEIERIKGLGLSPILEIDVQGCETISKKLDIISVFILPPTLEDMWIRLEKRGTDSFATRWTRLLNAKSEIEKAKNYSFFIINDDLERAFEAIEQLIIFNNPTLSLSQDQGLLHCSDLLKEFSSGSWINKLRSDNEHK